MRLEKLESLHNNISQILTLTLRVVNLVSLVQVLGLEEVHDGQDLSIVWHESLTNSIAAGNESLQDLQSRGNDLRVTRVKCR